MSSICTFQPVSYEVRYLDLGSKLRFRRSRWRYLRRRSKLRRKVLSLESISSHYSAQCEETSVGSASAEMRRHESASVAVIANHEGDTRLRALRQ